MSECEELGSVRFRREYADDLLKLADLLSFRVALHDNVQTLRNVVQNMDQPFKVAVFGYMKRGKSSLVNALIGQLLAVTGTEESTATVNHITYGAGNACDSFMVHWKNSLPERRPFDELEKWCGKGNLLEQLVDGVNYLQLFADSPMVKQMTVIDTPGIGSSGDFHDEIARQFLCGDNTDALLYVLGPHDREDDFLVLNRFRQLGMQGYETYNCLGVMHLWDEVYWNESANSCHADAWRKVGEHVSRLKANYREVLQDVVPVSAPLGILASLMPVEFWQEVVTYLSSFESVQKLRSVLWKPETYWRRSAPVLYSLWLKASSVSTPLISFRACLYYLRSQAPVNAEEARRQVNHFSGIPRLRALVDSLFFKRRAVINLRRIRSQVQTILKDSRIILEKETGKLENELVYFQSLLDFMHQGPLRKQTELYFLAARRQMECLRESSLKIDALRIRAEERVQQMDNAYFLLEEWEEKSRWLTDAEVKNLNACAKLVLDKPLQEGETATPELLLNYAGFLACLPGGTNHACAGKIRSLHAAILKH